MDVASWIIVGIAAGTFARALMPGPAVGGIPVGISIGLVGALIGGLIGNFFLVTIAAPFNFISLITATVGALYPLFAFRCVALRFA